MAVKTFTDRLVLTRRNLLVLLVMAGAILSPTLTAARGQKVSFGPSAPLGDGTIRSYLVMDRRDRPVALGVIFPHSAFSNLPTTEHDGHHCYQGKCAGGHERILALPKQGFVPPFKWVLFNWNPHGHEPEGVYTAPHFDVHFYTMDLATRNTIDPGPCGIIVDCEDYQRGIQPVPPPYLPQDYTDLGEVEVAMGNHLIDLTGPEFNGQPFVHTFIYGSYEGKITFYEPMITVAYLQSKPNRCVKLKLPTAYQESGFYPRTYCMKYHRGYYTISLEQFVYQQATEPIHSFHTRH